MPAPIRELISAAEATLAAAGVDSPRADAELLAAHAAGVDRSRIAVWAVTGHTPDTHVADCYRQLIDARAARAPLQHLTGYAAFGPLTLRVGPGVFVPRPETEALLEWALGVEASNPVASSRRASSSNPAVAVDLCAGSGALGLALAHHHPDARVWLVENSPAALAYTRRNAEPYPNVTVLDADATDPGLLGELNGRVDLLVCNPPYIPDGAALPAEAAADPDRALFGGPDGMSVIGPLAAVAARLLRPGGAIGVEHDDTTAEATVAVLRDAGVFDDIVARTDLTGRPRFVTAVRARNGGERE
ncbi:peptide chain release factor N(5)-glutamine methyltransferase [Mycolicibacterium brumae]|uniref:peptide chain release factor N(5)-glutamine methyltransferase n=1 Tax=Mycolicibacterium brumae TaxID=85968 RepID=UPI000ADE91DE|nr:peptide chain release factor N(5)-glutamine methyltransferase [Mycolicibacterium brumae]RWA22041.1 hypothetical protein MBRU_13735 [Mycolicibacterium brumae DSM 44177]UWW07964.1 peptide chain release factor N(5)-glutamine methyltransferase [Mycolicibacterium brumae]